jgi:tRNA A37 threonylcarbamoyladenosine dehydratase
MANSKTIGQIKTTALKHQLLNINPDAEIIDYQMIYSAENSDFFNLATYDYVIDAIDSIQHKVHLIQTVTRTDAKLFSAMGAALKISSTKIKVDEFWKVSGCPLAAVLRRKFKKNGMPAKKFLCVYSDELLQNSEQNDTCGTKDCLCPKNINPDDQLENHEWCSSKAIINGTLAHITAIFGFTLAGLVIEDIWKNSI